MSMPLVLLVDEDEDTLRILGIALEHAGYRVVSAGGAEVGLELARRNEPDVVVGDFPMMVGGRARFTDCLRAEPRFRWTPVLSVTARVMADELAVTRSVADEVLLKPVSPGVVVAAVARLLAPGSGYDEIRSAAAEAGRGLLRG
jgi:CheY-like chemotaxis protein